MNNDNISRDDKTATVNPAIVYVRRISADSLPSDLRNQIGGIKDLYSVHDEDGARLALVNDRRLAFTLARQHDLAPVSVH